MKPTVLLDAASLAGWNQYQDVPIGSTCWITQTAAMSISENKLSLVNQYTHNDSPTYTQGL